MKESADWLGKMNVAPKGEIVAGSYGSWVFTYTAGRYGVDNGGRLKLLFRFASDGGTPQTTDPTAENYVTATSSNPNVSVMIRVEIKGGRRPFLPCVVFEIKEDSLAEGDQLFITLGDQSGGSRGYKAQSFVESDYTWRMDVESFETGTYVELPDCPVTPIIAAQPNRIVGITRSEWVTDKPLSVLMKCEDQYGNPATYQGKAQLSVERIVNGQAVAASKDTFDGNEKVTFELKDQGCKQVEGWKFHEPGQYRFRLSADQLLNSQAYSNIITITAEASSLQHHWGDLHGQYNNALGTGSVEEAFTYARDAAGCEFVGHQPNDFQLHESGWLEAKEAVARMHGPGKFIPFLGYEWSGTTPAGGDRNVHYLTDDGPLHRTSHWHVPDKSDVAMDRYPLNELYDTFKGRDDVFMVPHVGGRRCDITKYYDPELEPVIEIASCHGRFEWLLHEAIENGYTVGVIAGSDDHTGRPGAAYPTDHGFGTRGGLAAIFADSLTREGIVKALKARHCYGTTGERIGLQVTTADGGMMGDVISGSKAPAMTIKATGTKPIERIDIVRNHDVVYTHPMYTKDDYSKDKIRIEWGGAMLKGRGRHAKWDGSLTVENGTIRSSEAFAFDHPLQGITHQDTTKVSWTSTTSGDHDGIILELDADENTVIHLESELCTEHIHVKELSDIAHRVDCGGVEQYVSFSLQPIVPGPLSVEFNWQDEQPLSGRNAYWIRYVQEDGEMAWSSPIYYDKI